MTSRNEKKLKLRMWVDKLVIRNGLISWYGDTYCCCFSLRLILIFPGLVYFAPLFA